MGLNRRIIEWMDRSLYPNTAPHWDNQLFRETIVAVLKKHYVVLDVGAGVGILPHTNYRGMAARVCGIDPDERVRENPNLDESKVAFAEDIPYPDNSFDLAFCSNVLEHLERPDVVLSEVRRVLKPGGIFVAKTPNLWHYMAMTARLAPHWLHELIISRIFTRTAKDIFPTLYRANTRRSVTRHARAADLEVVSVEFFEDRPEYLRFSVPTYVAGWAYERIVSWSGLERFRIVMIATMKKRSWGNDTPEGQ